MRLLFFAKQQQERKPLQIQFQHCIGFTRCAAWFQNKIIFSSLLHLLSVIKVRKVRCLDVLIIRLVSFYNLETLVKRDLFFQKNAKRQSFSKKLKVEIHTVK